MKSLLIWFVCTAAFATMLVPRRGLVAGILWSVPLGTAMALAVGSLWLSAIALRDRKLIEDSVGLVAPADRQSVMVCGKIEAQGNLVRSPIHGEQCVAYQYLIQHSVSTGRLSRRRGSGFKEVVDYAGFGIVPAVVRGTLFTASLGDFPILHDFGKFELEEPTPLDAAERYLRSATFDPVPESEMIEYIEVMDKKWDGRGTLFKNFRREEGYFPKDGRFWEQRVAPGSDVCVVGVWSDSQRALVGTSNQDLELHAGTADEVRRKLAGSVGTGIVIALLLATGSIAAAVYLVLP